MKYHRARLRVQHKVAGTCATKRPLTYNVRLTEVERPTGAAALPPTHVYYCLTSTLGAGAVDAALNNLDEYDRERCARFREKSDRRDCAVAHALLRSALSAHAAVAPRDWRFATAPHGKPCLAPSMTAPLALSFNLSHTRGLVACAVSLDPGVDVGIDAECVDRAVETLSLAGHFFSSREVEEMAASDDAAQPLRFFDLWTLKEAYIKATGEGLSSPLDRIAFQFLGSSSIRFALFDARDATTDWQFALFGLDDRYRVAVALRDRHSRGPRLVVLHAEYGQAAGLALLRTSG